MSDDNVQFSPPGPEHERLRRNLGQWKVECEFFMDASQPPVKVEATDTVEEHGPYHVTGRFHAPDFFGMPFSGIATVGYDPVRGCYVSTWCDSMTPYFYVFEGQVDESGKVMTFTGENPDPNSKQMTKWRTREEEIDDQTRVFEMWMTIPGTSDEFQLSRYTYRRI